MVIDKGDELIFAFETSFIWLFGGTSVITHFIYKCIKIVKLKFYSSYSSKRSIDQANIILIEGSDKFIYREFFFLEILWIVRSTFKLEPKIFGKGWKIHWLFR